MWGREGGLDLGDIGDTESPDRDGLGTEAILRSSREEAGPVPALGLPGPTSVWERRCHAPGASRWGSRRQGRLSTIRRQI